MDIADSSPGKLSPRAQRRFDSLNADTLAIGDPAGLLDVFDAGNSAGVQRHFLNRDESGRLKERLQGIGVVHPFVLVKVFQRRINAVQEITGGRRRRAHQQPVIQAIGGLQSLKIF